MKSRPLSRVEHVWCRTNPGQNEGIFGSRGGTEQAYALALALDVKCGQNRSDGPLHEVRWLATSRWDNSTVREDTSCS